MGKKVKTYNEKNRPMTEAEKAALRHIQEKTHGVKKKKEQILTPEDLKLQDVKFDGSKKKEQGQYVQGKLITEKDLEEERKKEQEEKERFEQEFKRQLSEWSKEDHSSIYDFAEFEHEDYLVRVFKMDVSDFSGFKTLEYEWSQIKQNYKLKDAPATENVFPIVKILKVGKGVKSNYKVGDICLVPSTDVAGEDWNPKFLHIMQFQDSKGMKPKLPEGMRQSLPNVEIKWDRYQFIRPWKKEPEDIDQLTFLIPEAKIRGKYLVV